MISKSIKVFILCIIIPHAVISQVDHTGRVKTLMSEADKEASEGWTHGGGIGLDLGQFLIINPRVGAGDNRLGFGGAISYFAKYRKDKLAWDSFSSYNFGVQRLGSGVIPGLEAKIPFQKSIDEFRLSSKVGYKVRESSKFFYAFDLAFISQFIGTYRGTDGKNYIKEVVNPDPDGFRTNLVSKFLNPASLTLSTGIDFKPNDNYSIFFSPLSIKAIIITNENIAQLGVHGNKLKDETNPGLGYKKTDWQLGGTLKARYSGQLFNEQLGWNSSIIFYSNYLRNPQNVDLDWTNEFVFMIFKGIAVSVWTNIYYDDDILVNISDQSFPGGVTDQLGKRVSFTEQLLLKYIKTF